MTYDFVSAAELMSRVLGLPDYRFAVIDHPVSSADDKGLNQRARTAIKDLGEIVLTNATGPSNGT